LSADAAVSGDADPFTDPVLGLSQMLVSCAVPVLLLRFIEDRVVLGGYEGRHEDPFRDRRAVDSAGRRERDFRVFDDPMVRPGVDAGREEMYKLNAANGHLMSEIPSSLKLIYIYIYIYIYIKRQRGMITRKAVLERG
jgi:hypothetical protein